ncbi:branched-chain amino acid ABC transporter permease [Oceanicella actignis]|uniref:Branched-chain amino acid transport system permease protein n=1 Tax=Oceanicella actignis TaxID=1189325 RepID=A0A1M7TAM8_9RHOB|nr:branched-chain amino acid ABC transporter permease [Oceanicella actignis]SET52533.1 branched-chain amino acid transport system permease protein [Oceanicella actignis]SHN67774.1 branched-chain amino acid transport system permease protein [Oceanicella actignis]
MAEDARDTRATLALLAALAAAAAGAHAMGEPFYVNMAARVAILAMAAAGLNLALGFGGMVSFGHAAFFGLGGYAAGVAAWHAANQIPLTTWPIVVSGTDRMIVVWAAAAATGGLAALLIGALSLRTSGVQFIMITLAFAQMFYYFAISWPAYGGEDGLPIYLRNGIEGLDVYDPLTFFVICFAWLAATLAGTARIMRARFGAALTMARLSEARLASAGVDPFPVRLAAFALSGAVAAVAGALNADLNGFVGPSALSWKMSGELMAFVILGGVGRLGGPVAGAAAFVLLEHFLGAATERWVLVFGALLLGVTLFARGGLLGLLAGRARHG